jgi:hypothetical protein
VAETCIMYTVCVIHFYTLMCIFLFYVPYLIAEGTVMDLLKFTPGMFTVV